MLKTYFIFSILMILFTSFLFAQEDNGSVLSGQVLDSFSKVAVVGAVVEFTEKNLRTQTDRDGTFRLSELPSGSQVIRIRSLGYNERETVVDITPGASNFLTIELIPVFRESVEVEVPFLEGQAKALNQQKTAINIKNIVSADQIGRFPDSNATEATQRLPGVTLERDQGEGRFVQIRGTEPRLTSVSINGERIPAPEGDIRFVGLDVIPADLLEAIEVSKALTPDMESDAIGGAINLVTKTPPDKVRSVSEPVAIFAGASRWFGSLCKLHVRGFRNGAPWNSHGESARSGEAEILASAGRDSCLSVKTMGQQYIHKPIS
ncbi:TonB-dependent receptor plug domain-containing protein [bacterium]|nr:TonB-dependent receptor plug domain-containing protein [bacterium]MCI0604304.1 TonB-dependent receptor plug domain-containing protein [bacterium]